MPSRTRAEVGRTYTYAWGRMGRKGEPCRVLAVARRMNSVLVEFADGHRAVTSANALRALKAGGRQLRMNLGEDA